MAKSASHPPKARPEPTASWPDSFSAMLRLWCFICLHSPLGWEGLA